MSPWGWEQQSKKASQMVAFRPIVVLDARFSSMFPPPSLAKMFAIARDTVAARCATRTTLVSHRCGVVCSCHMMKERPCAATPGDGDT